MTIHEASRQLRFQLNHDYGDREAELITQWVMEHITGWGRIDRIENKKVPLSLPQQQLFHQYSEALAAHQPVQYVLHESWFYGMKLYVDENVLIPRPETEELADWVIKESKELRRVSGKYLDIGTGSGCIPLALKKGLPFAHIQACDISLAALDVAKKNGTSLGLVVEWFLFDILDESKWAEREVYDVMVSNPPYVPKRDQSSMPAHVLQYEPHLALFVEDSDALLFYRAIADFALLKLHPGGRLYFEIHEEKGKEVVALLQSKSFTDISLLKDMQGKDRMVRATRALS